jgi:hypothetical protein
MNNLCSGTSELVPHSSRGWIFLRPAGRPGALRLLASPLCTPLPPPLSRRDTVTTVTAFPINGLGCHGCHGSRLLP